MDLCNPKEIKALLGRHGFRFSKQMGQNFLIQPWVPRQTAEASGAGPGIGVREIGRARGHFKDGHPRPLPGETGGPAGGGLRKPTL